MSTDNQTPQQIQAAAAAEFQARYVQPAFFAKLAQDFADVCPDLSNPANREALLRLAAHCDQLYSLKQAGDAAAAASDVQAAENDLMAVMKQAGLQNAAAPAVNQAVAAAATEASQDPNATALVHALFGIV